MVCLDASSGTIICDAVDIHNEDRSVVLRHLEVRDLVIISTISPEVKSLVDKHFVRNWEIALAAFVPSPRGLRDAMRASRAVISGSLALWFIIGGSDRWFSHDCDLYTPKGEATQIKAYLCSQAGYEPDKSRHDFVNDESDEYEDSSSPDPRANPSIASVTHLCNKSGRKIDIIESSGASPLFPLPRFWCTFLPNYVSADTLCCPYPYLTMRRQGCLCVADGAPIAPVLRAIEKYKDRRFIIGDFSANFSPYISRGYPKIQAQGCQFNPYCPHTRRYFGDKWCLQYCFGDGAASALVDDLTTRWRYGGNQCGVCNRHSSVEVDVVRLNQADIIG